MINKNKTVIITGSLGGIGIEITRLFYKRKYTSLLLITKLTLHLKKLFSIKPMPKILSCIKK